MNICTLPVGVRRANLAYCDVRDLCRLACVNRTHGQLATDPMVWRAMVQKKFSTEEIHAALAEAKTESVDNGVFDTNTSLKHKSCSLPSETHPSYWKQVYRYIDYESDHAFLNPPASFRSHDGKDYDGLVKLVLVGPSGAGKSSLLRRFADAEFDVPFRGTMGVDFRIKRVKAAHSVVKLQVWDTAGEERFRTITTAYYRGCTGMILCFDRSKRHSFDDVRKYAEEAHEQTKAPIMLVGCQSDRGKSNAPPLVSELEAESCAKDCNCVGYASTSSLTGMGVTFAFRRLTAAALQFGRPPAAVSSPPPVQQQWCAIA